MSQLIFSQNLRNLFLSNVRVLAQMQNLTVIEGNAESKDVKVKLRPIVTGG